MSSRWTHVLIGLVATALLVTSLTFALTTPASSTDTVAEASGGLAEAGARWPAGRAPHSGGRAHGTSGARGESADQARSASRGQRPSAQPTTPGASAPGTSGTGAAAPSTAPRPSTGSANSPAPSPSAASSPPAAAAPSSSTASTPAASPSAPSSSAPSSSAAPAAPAPAASSGVASGPQGIPGSWIQTWGDEFNGTTLDRSRWSDMDGRSMNGVTTRASNVAVTGGNLVLTLSSSGEGAFVSSAPSDGAGANGFLLPVGQYAEARVYFPGDGRRLYNWPAWWTSGPSWPASGEHDIAEVLGGDLTVNYHSNSGAHNQGAVNGYWGDAYHVYGIHRLADRADVYWDGQLVKSYRTDDNSNGQSLLINVGRGEPSVTGAGSQVKVDWVRVWRQG